MNVYRGSPNVWTFSGYLLSPTRLPPIAGLQTLARVFIHLYYLYKTTYIVNLNSRINRSSPVFEPGSLGLKAATLPVCYTPLTPCTPGYLLPRIFLSIHWNLDVDFIGSKVSNKKKKNLFSLFWPGIEPKTLQCTYQQIGILKANIFQNNWPLNLHERWKKWKKSYQNYEVWSWKLEVENFHSKTRVN